MVPAIISLTRLRNEYEKKKKNNHKNHDIEIKQVVSYYSTVLFLALKNESKIYCKFSVSFLPIKYYTILRTYLNLGGAGLSEDLLMMNGV